MATADESVRRATLGMRSLEHYEPLIGTAAVERIQRKADRLEGSRIAHISSTFYGGGVAEILNTVDAPDERYRHRCRVASHPGDARFFHCTKMLHNALQGEAVALTSHERAIYEEVLSVEQAADRIVQLIKDEELGRRLGANVKESVRERFLLCHLLDEWIDVIAGSVGTRR